MPRKDHAAMGDAAARLVLTSPPAKPTKKASKSSPRATHKRTMRVATVATLRAIEGGYALDINDVLTKNDRYVHTKFGQAESALAKAYKAAVSVAASRLGFVPPIKVPKAGKRKAETIYGEKTIRTGRWMLEVVSFWPAQRHLDDVEQFAFGDSDAPLSMVRDALQRAGVIDDDMRISSDRTHAVYAKDAGRRTVALLRRLPAESHAQSVAAVMGVLG